MGDDAALDLSVGLVALGRDEIDVTVAFKMATTRLKKKLIDENTNGGDDDGNNGPRLRLQKS